MPTIKQEKAFKLTMDNYGNVSKSMREAGYSKNSAKNPKILTESDGWLELVEQHLPDKLLVKVHKEGLAATRPFSSHTEPDKEVPDYAVRHKYLESALQVKGRYAPTKSINLNLNEEITNPKARELAEKYETELKQSL